MPSKSLYSVVAAVGIAAASGAAWWYQNKPQRAADEKAPGAVATPAPADPAHFVAALRHHVRGGVQVQAIAPLRRRHEGDAEKSGNKAKQD